MGENLKKPIFLYIFTTLPQRYALFLPEKGLLYKTTVVWRLLTHRTQTRNKLWHSLCGSPKFDLLRDI